MNRPTRARCRNVSSAFRITRSEKVFRQRIYESSGHSRSTRRTIIRVAVTISRSAVIKSGTAYLAGRFPLTIRPVPAWDGHAATVATAATAGRWRLTTALTCGG